MPNNVKHAIDQTLHSLRTTEDERSAILTNCLEGRSVKRKVSVAFVMTVILVLLAATALAVTAITGRLRFMKPDEGPQALGCTVMDDTLYMMTNHGLMIWNPEDQATMTLIDELHLRRQGVSVFSLPFAADSLLLLDQDHQSIWRYTDDTLEEVRKLEGAITRHSRGSYSQPVAVQEYMYVRVMYEAEKELWRVNLSTGQAEMLFNNVIELSNYRDGQLLALQRDYAGTDTVVTIDAASGAILDTIATIPIAQLEGLAYDAANDRIYAVNSGMLCRWNGTDWVPLQTAALPPMSNNFCILSGGYVASSYAGIEFINISANDTRPTLVVRGWRNIHSVEDDFVEDHPDIQFKRENRAWFNGAIITEALDAGDAVDIFYVRLDATVVKLMQNGRLASLSQHPILAEDIAQMPLSIQSAVSPSGTASALPASIHIPLWMIRDDADIQPPATLIELLAQNVAWTENPGSKAIFLANDYTAITWTRQDYARYALTQAWDEAAIDGQIPDFSTAAFTTFLEALKDAKLSAVSYPEENTLVTANSFFMLRGRTEDEPYLLRRVINPPAVTVAETDVFPSWLLVYVLNPNSKNMSAALEFLEYVAQNRKAGDQALLSPDTAKPSLYPYAMVPGFEPLQHSPDSWEVTADELALYQTEIAPKLWVSRYPYSKDHASMVDTVVAYLNDEITLSECTAQLNALAAGVSEE